MMTTRRTLIFTDLDGTLLDRDTYSYEAARPALDKLRDKGTPLIFCSAKTRAEQEVYRRELDIRDPFIVEDGGAVFIGQKYFDFPFNYDKTQAEYKVIEFGVPYRVIRQTLVEVAMETGMRIRGFGNMNVDEVAQVTDLDSDAAQRAKSREYAETLVKAFSDDEINTLEKALADRGFKLTHGGRFHGVVGANDKGKAARHLIELYRRQNGAQLYTVGIGDSHNDEAMLAVMDRPMQVQKPDGAWENLEVENIERIDGVGPEGWNRAILEILSQ